MLVRARRGWHERWHVRVVKRCTGCGMRLIYPHVRGSRPNTARLARIALLGLIFLLVAVAGPALVIYVLPTPDTAMGGGTVIEN